MTPKLPADMIARVDEFTDWRSPDLAERMLRLALACDTCDDGVEWHKAPEGDTGYPCSPCHGTGLRDVEWRCVMDGENYSSCTFDGRKERKWNSHHTENCGLVLIIPLEDD